MKKVNLREKFKAVLNAIVRAIVIVIITTLKEIIDEEGNNGEKR